MHTFRTDDKVVFPVKSGTKVIKLVLLISGTSYDLKICVYQYLQVKKIYINSSQVLTKIIAIVSVI